MESWRAVWRKGLEPQFSADGLAALRDAVRDDDPRLTQGSTTTPPPLMVVQNWPVEAADALGFVGAATLGGFLGDTPSPATVGQVEEFFARACLQADQSIGEPAACRWWLNWFDDTPRDEMRRDLLEELEYNLSARGVGPAKPDPLHPRLATA